MTEAAAETESLFPDFDHGGPDHARLREFSADFTPRPVVRQLFDEMRTRNLGPRGGHHLRILDAGAGAGVFSDEARACYPDAHIVAVEVRLEEEKYLLVKQEADIINEYVPHSLEDYAKSWARDGAIPFDLIVGNPPFKLWKEFVRIFRTMLHPTGWSVQLGLTSWPQRSEEGQALFEEYPASAQHNIAGPIGFRGPGVNPRTGKPWGMDQRDYCWWCHKHPSRSPTATQSWPAATFPRLSLNDRRWKVRPGTEGF